MRLQWIWAIVPCFLFVCACSSEASKSDNSKETDSATDGTDAPNTTYSCRYNNKFAGPDCKEYLGTNWNAEGAREQNCGSGFVEEDAVLVAEACPASIDIEGVPTTARGVCHADAGGPDAYDLYSYAGDLGALETACKSFMNGEWEALTDDNTEQKLHENLPEALDALDSSDKVTVSSQCKDTDCLLQMIADGETFDFTPVGQTPLAGFVFYPGGNVDPRAYAPSAVAMAERGVFVSIVPMENYLSLSGYMRADDVRAANPSMEKWFVGGHSLGGTMAARYGTTDTGRTVAGVIIWASVAGDEYNISDSGLKVLSIYGALDTGNSPAQVKEYADTLPPDAVYICIDGGDHAQFAYYVDDNGAPTISREAQQKQIIQATVDFIKDPTGLSSVACSSI